MGKFEFKIITALLVAVLVPLGVSIFLVDRAVSSSYAMGVNPQVQGGLENALESYRDLFKNLKEKYEAVTALIASSPTLGRLHPDTDRSETEAFLRKELEQYPDIRKLTLRTSTGDSLSVTSEQRFPEEKFRPFTVTTPVANEHISSIEAEFMAPIGPFSRFESLGKLLQTYERLDEGRDFLKRRYLLIYVLLISLVIIVSLAVAFGFARSITRRISSLAAATAKVAGGDLTVHVQPGAEDEVGELINRFNLMVAEMKESQERIEYLRKISAWQEMARRLAHEIKNPLTPIQLAMQQVRDTYRGDDVTYRNLLSQSAEIVEEEITTLRRLTGEFSAFSKLPEVKPEAVDLVSYLEECQASLAHLSSESGVAIAWSLPKGPVTAPIDRMLFKRALDNLVRNAVEASQAGGGREVRIRLRVLSKDRAAEIVVEDDGIGVADDVRGVIFDPYFTTKEEGTGLGLAIVKKIILEHHGEVGVDPSYGPGARFVVRIPLA